MKKNKFYTIGIGIIIVALMILSNTALAVPRALNTGNNKIMTKVIDEIPNDLKENIPKLKDFYPSEHPDWADGWYLGIWFDKTGDEYTFLGFLAGYYHQGARTRGYYAGVWNTTDNATVGGMGGIAFGIWTFGRIQVKDGPKIPYSGFLLHNETHFIGRIMSFVGNPVYMYGIHQQLQ
jgi:hypothetical protein